MICSLNICNNTKNDSAQSYLRKMLLRRLSLLFSNDDSVAATVRRPEEHLFGIILKYRTFFVFVNVAMNYICKQVKILRLFKFHHHWFSAKEFTDWWIHMTYQKSYQYLMCSFVPTCRGWSNCKFGKKNPKVNLIVIKEWPKNTLPPF